MNDAVRTINREQADVDLIPCLEKEAQWIFGRILKRHKSTNPPTVKDV